MRPLPRTNTMEKGKGNEGRKAVAGKENSRVSSFPLLTSKIN